MELAEYMQAVDALNRDPRATTEQKIIGQRALAALHEEFVVHVQKDLEEEEIA